jgi:aspartate kinase
MPAKCVVMKFGGASVASPESFSRIADIIIQKRVEVDRLIVVVSAMGDTTDQLISLAKQVNPSPPRREYDMLISVGERVSISLLAMALAAKGVEAASFTGSQSGIMTCECHSDAKIVDVRPHRLLPYLDKGAIVIVAGFQGVSCSGQITTLGRGGSDTTAVALGIAFQSDYVEFYKDVPGIYSSDPKLDPEAKHLSRLDYSELMDILERGSGVLHARSVELARKNGVPLKVLSFETINQGASETIVGKEGERIRAPIYETP